MSNCLNCGKEIEIINFSSKYKRFCNRSCSATYNNSRREVKPEWFDSIRGRTFYKHTHCATCNKELDHTIILGNIKFCNDVCKKLKKDSRKKNSLDQLESGESKAKICDFPYENKKYYILNSQDRNSVAIHNIDDGKHFKTISLAKYMMEVHLKRYLDIDEEVDHINNIKSDDRIENFQILTRKENIRKHAKEIKRGKFLVELICPCGQQFIKEKYNTHLCKSRKSINTYCSQECKYKLSSKLKENKTVVIREFKEFE